MAAKNKKEKLTIDDLALMVGKGFEDVGERIESLRKENAREHKEMTSSNAREHEDMALRLDNVAYRFELVELKKRVEVLEKKVIRHN